MDFLRGCSTQNVHQVFFFESYSIALDIDFIMPADLNLTQFNTFCLCVRWSELFGSGRLYACFKWVLSVWRRGVSRGGERRRAHFPNASKYRNFLSTVLSYYSVPSGRPRTKQKRGIWLHREILKTGAFLCTKYKGKMESTKYVSTGMPVWEYMCSSGWAHDMS